MKPADWMKIAIAIFAGGVAWGSLHADLAALHSQVDRIELRQIRQDATVSYGQGSLPDVLAVGVAGRR